MAAPAIQQQPAPLPSPPHLQFRRQEPPSSLQRSDSQALSPLKQQVSQSSQSSKPKTKTRTFSIRSDKSRRGISTKPVLNETSAEKDARRLRSKADPSVAMNEAEPALVAATVATSLSPLRNMQHKDAFGNVIADPDKSNPTRPRWERPLDTIRSFEAAIEGDYARRSTFRSDMDPAAIYSRRNSYHPPNPPRFPQDSYYGNRTASFRDEGAYGMTTGAARHSSYESQGYNGAYYTSHNGYSDPGNIGMSHGRYYSRQSRMSPENYHQGHGREQPNVYHLPHKDRSYETVTSAAASGSSEAAGYQTDPTSSDNSSIHRQSPIKSVNDNGVRFPHQSQHHRSPNRSPNFGIPRKDPMLKPPAPSYQGNPQSATTRQQITITKRQSFQHQQQHQQQQQQVPPQPQPQPESQPLTKAQSPSPSELQPPSAASEKKRGSWFGRRLSKKS